MKELLYQIYNEIIRSASLGTFSLTKGKLKKSFPILNMIDQEKKKELEEILDIKINYVGYFEQALMHRSHPNVHHGDGIASNERLEFLGDSILGMVVAEYLFSLNMKEVEGELTKLRSIIVSKNALALCAEELDLGRFLFMSYSAERALKNGSVSILADALEAVIAAIYLDSGPKAAKDFITNRLLPIVRDKTSFAYRNYKSMLLETVQAKGFSAPKYIVLEENGPAHDKEFIIGVYVNDIFLGQGVGKNKKEAEQIAAYQGIENFKNNKFNELN